MTLNEFIDKLIETRQRGGADKPVSVLLVDPMTPLAFTGEVADLLYDVDDQRCKLKCDLDMEASRQLAGDLRDFQKQFQQILVEFGWYGDETK